MPHCIIEYAQPLDNADLLSQLLNTVQTTVSDSGLFDTSAVGSRLIPYQHYILVPGNKRFIHVTIRLLAGRTDDQKAQLTHSVVTALQTLNISDIKLSCECVDIHKASYHTVLN